MKGIAKLSGHEQVVEFMKNLKHPLKESMEVVREVILNANKGITEHIKWNSPSYCFEGEDRVTFNVHKNDNIMMVFHRGASLKDRRGKRILFKDTTG